MFEREDWTLFRELPRLGQRAGVPLRLLPRLVLKELVDNALDVAGREGFEAGRQDNGFFVQDGGSGFDGDDARIASIFSINRPLASSKLLRLPTRGALGNGLRVVTGAVLASGGTLHVSTRGRTLRLAPQDDTGATVAEVVGTYDRPGSRIDVALGPALHVGHDVLEWAQAAFDLADGESAYKGKTSAYWYDSASFFELLRAAPGRTVADVIGEFDGCAHPKAGKIAREFAGRPAVSLDRAESDRLLSRARESSKPVAPKRLGCVGWDVSGYPADHVKVLGNLTLDKGHGSHGGIVPCVVEGWAAVADEASVGISVNRTPITADVRAFHNAKDKSIAIYGSGLSLTFPVGRKPVRLRLNLDSPCVPITSDGKAPDLGVFFSLIDEVVRRVVNRAKLRERYSKPLAAVPTTQKGVILGCLDAAIAKAGDDGRLRYSLRQLFYAVRPHVIEAFGKQPSYEYFCQVVTDHENKAGRDLPGIYRDSRGTLYHPHSGEVIPLGTLNVERYERPAWSFNKILYSEKEGFFEVLRDVRWPERHDCALMTSKGFASRAARDVLDLLGETGEPLTFYCIHDADASGTMIYQALQEATRARAGRSVRIVNLGLEPAEALEMGLQVEDATPADGKAAPVADYVPKEWGAWLQTKRVELNAMTTAQFLAWLDRKFADLAGKVVPPAPVLADRLGSDVRDELGRRIASDLLAEGDHSGRVERAFAALQPAIEVRSGTIAEDVRAGLDVEPARSWAAPVRRVAAEIAGGDP